ncbi:MAG: DUF5668 domain-containing protein [Treponema sp.]|jgi:hypothetical protein|nr:DUF5668 domain-containing protein [Treponema sp.]
MLSSVNRRLTARFVFIIGLLFMFLGSAFLLGSLAGISRISVLLAFLCVIVGSGCAVLAIKRNKRSLYLFFAAFFILVGFFLLLSALRIIPVSFSEAWPLISVFSGLALFPAGWHRYGRFRNHYVVPSIAFVLLGCVLLIFSFNIVPFSFTQFMVNWWPLLIVLAGLILVLVSLSTKNNSDDINRRDSKK